LPVVLVEEDEEVMVLAVVLVEEDEEVVVLPVVLVEEVDGEEDKLASEVIGTEIEEEGK
jgi:hypothetical protein